MNFRFSATEVMIIEGSCRVDLQFKDVTFFLHLSLELGDDLFGACFESFAQIGDLSIVIANELLDMLLMGKLGSPQFDLELFLFVSQNFLVRGDFGRLLFKRVHVVHSKFGRAVLVLEKKLLRLLLVD